MLVKPITFGTIQIANYRIHMVNRAIQPWPNRAECLEACIVMRTLQNANVSRASYLWKALKIAVHFFK